MIFESSNFPGARIKKQYCDFLGAQRTKGELNANYEMQLYC